MHLFASSLTPSIVNANSKILYVDDGSSDNTLACIKELNKKNKEVLCISLSKNRGHQNALLAGLMTAKSYADIIISMDCDGQDDINAVDKMIEKYNDGCDIVYGVRNERKTDSFFKRNTALLFYKFINSLGVESIYNHADFRLMSKRALDELEKYDEVNLYLRGQIPMLGFKTDIVYYDRTERLAGETHYPFSKMFGLAINAITNLQTILDSKQDILLTEENSGIVLENNYIRLDNLILDCGTSTTVI